MRLAFSTNAFKQTSLEQAIQSIAEIGYAGVEIMADAPHALPADMPSARRRAVRALLSRVGLAVSNVNAFTLFAAGDTYHPTWIEDDPAMVRRRIEHTLACIELAGELGSPTVSLQPGGPMPDDQRREEYLRRFRDGLGQVLPAARRAGVVLAIEPEPGLLIESAREYLEFVADFRDAFLACNFDIGHLFCVGEDPVQAARELGSHIAHVHLEDIAATRVHQHLVPGAGAIDLPAVLAGLRDAGYDGFVTVELYPYVDSAEGVARATMAYLRQRVAWLAPPT